MIFDIYGAVFIAFGLIALVLGFIKYQVRITQNECKHTNWTNYQSIGERKCIDCGCIEKISKYYPTHQR